jgi:AmmeMemoRadiSam system protein A
MLSPDEKRTLITIARGSISAALSLPGAGGRPVEEPAGGALATACGAFVTLHIGGELRGCIGYIESEEPLSKIVSEVAVKAALEDPRFPPLTPAEYPRISVEISVLSPPKKISAVDEIEVGRHGLLLQHEWHRGLLLPQVAAEYGWTREEFLENVARKAGLPRTAWRDTATELYVFTAEIINEEQLSS